MMPAIEPRRGLNIRGDLPLAPDAVGWGRLRITRQHSRGRTHAILLSRLSPALSSVAHVRDETPPLRGLTARQTPPLRSPDEGDPEKSLRTFPSNGAT